MTPSELRELEEIQKRNDTSAPIHCEKAARTREENARAILSYNKCREDRATLISLIESLRAREGWLPIESAPRDGTNVLLAIVWENSPTGWAVGEASFNPETGSDGEWWWANTCAGDPTGEYIVPIHGAMWQPLPKAPSPPSTPEQG